MLIWLALASLTQSPPGPIDAFRANLASVKAGTDFDFRIWYNYNANNLNHIYRFESGAGPAGDPGYVIRGRWEFDGSSERYLGRVTGGRLFRPGASNGPMPPVEVLCDRDTYILHYLRPGESALRYHELLDGFTVALVGPFTWYSGYSFDRYMRLKHGGPPQGRGTGERGGHPTETEFYERTEGEFRRRTEIDYDPSVGFVPRFVRMLTDGPDRGRSVASVEDFYLIDAKPCSAGGFVPTEWYQVFYHIMDFESKHSDYSRGTKLPTPDQATIYHFKADRLEDKKDRARLVEMSGVDEVFAPGGVAALKADRGPMTLSELKAAIGAKAHAPNRPVLPNIDAAELHEFDRPKAKIHWAFYLVGGLALAAIVVFVARRRARMVVGLIGLVGLGGCGQKPVPRLTAGFMQTRLLYDPSRPTLKLDLVVNNAGNQTLRIMRVDGGCSCRHVDPAQLPATVRPGESVKLVVGMSGGRSFAEQTYMFTFITDQGPLTAPVALLSIPRHHLSPDTITMNGLYEASTDEDARFDMVHREVYEPGKRDLGASLVVPAGFVKEDREVHEGRVAGAPEFVFRDSEYRLTLQDKTLGLNRADVLVKGADGRKLVEAPLVWQRLPFLSSVPKRVSLAGRPARVFLRCPDEAVELTRVVATPPGIKAELDSPRSLRVALTDEAPATLQDFVEVETTAAGPKVLRIPVARYSSSVAARP